MEKKITILIPVYNEQKTLLKLLKKVNFLKVEHGAEIIVINDGSIDNSKKIIEENEAYYDRFISYEKNKGKGFAIKLAQKKIKEKYTIIQDADLEYDPKDYVKIIETLKKKKYKIVYGSRVLGINRYSNNNFTSNIRVLANHILTIISNIINSQHLTDAHTCYKAFDTKIFKKIKLKEDGFSFCPEVTTKISNLKLKIFEVKISYRGRTYKEGKKISFIDGFRALKTLLKYKIFIN